MNALPEKHEDAATVGIGSDRYPYSIVARTAKTVTVQPDEVKGVGDNSYTESQKYEYFANPDAAKQVYSLRKNGRYYRVGQPIGYGALHIGHRNFYRDPHF